MPLLSGLDFQAVQPHVRSGHGMSEQQHESLNKVLARNFLKEIKIELRMASDPFWLPVRFKMLAKAKTKIVFRFPLKQRLNVMDSTAFSLCLDNNVPILVFDLNDEHAIRRAVLGEKIGTLVRS